jgi:hypothetical protein
MCWLWCDVQAANAQLNSREGRLSPQLMARLLQHLLLKHPTALKQGWVLEGWPRNLSAALLATFVSAAGGSGSSSSSSGGAEAAGKAGSRRDSAAGVKVGRPVLAVAGYWCHGDKAAA